MSSIIEEKCKEKGVRLTDQRKVIAKVMSDSKLTYGAKDHPDVDELHKRVSLVDKKISIATVYRTVKLLEESGIIERHDFKEGKFHSTYSEWHDPVLNETPALWDNIDLPFLNQTIQMRTVSGCSFSCAFCSYPSTAKGLHTTELELVEKHLQKIFYQRARVN